MRQAGSVMLPPLSTLRLDFWHEGNFQFEGYRLRRLHHVGRWQNPLFLRPDRDYEYRIIVEDAVSQNLFHTLGFSPLFREWQTTLSAPVETAQKFNEHFYIPCPPSPFRFQIQRYHGGKYPPLYTHIFEPDALLQIPEFNSIESGMECMDILNHGDPATHVDILLFAEGYTQNEKESFIEAAHRFKTHLFAVAPFQRRINDFNIRAVFVPSRESGISDPFKGLTVDTPLAAAYGALGLERYLLPQNPTALHDLCAQIPWDTVVVLCNSKKFGGGGLFNQLTCYSAHSEHTDYLSVHEFAHAFAGLADEYYTAPVTYTQEQILTAPPLEPNISGIDALGKVKWDALIEPQTPVPTPWGKKSYEALEKKRYTLLEEQQKKEGPAFTKKAYHAIVKQTQSHFKRQTFYGKVGAFEGARYQSRGLYRAEMDCLMFTRQAKKFCRVCHDTIEAVIDAYTRPELTQTTR